MAASQQEILLKSHFTRHPVDLLCSPQFHRKLQTAPSVWFVWCQAQFCQHKSNAVLPVGAKKAQNSYMNIQEMVIICTEGHKIGVISNPRNAGNTINTI